MLLKSVLLYVVCFLVVMSCARERIKRHYDERRHCNLATHPVFPSDEHISMALQKLQSVTWVNILQQRKYNLYQIPQIFWINGKDTPKVVCPEHLRMLANNTNFKYAFINDEDAEVFMSEVFHNTSYLWAYHSLNHKLGAGKSDIYRYALMYVFGGAYMDLDSAIYYNLESYIQPQDGFIVGAEQPFWYDRENCYHSEFYLSDDKFNSEEFTNTLPWTQRKIYQSTLIARPRHPFIVRSMKNLVDIFNQLRCKRNRKVFAEKIDPQYKLLCSTGPDLLTASARQVMYESSPEVVTSNGIRYSGLEFAELGGVEKFDSYHTNGDLSPTYWKKLLDDGVSLLSNETSN